METKSKMSTFSRLFKPWKRIKKKKTSEKIGKQVADLERKISERSSRDDLIKRGVLKEVPVDDNLQSNERRCDRQKKVNDPGNQCDWNPFPPIVEDDSVIDLSFETSTSSIPTTVASNSVSMSSCTTTLPLLPLERISIADHGDGVSHVKFPGLFDLNRIVPPNRENDCTNASFISTQSVVKEESVPSVERSLPVASSVSFPEHERLQPSVPPSSQNVIPVQSPDSMTVFYIAPPPPPPDTDSVDANSRASYEEVYAYEPDLSKKPARSALKGAKNKELLQQQLLEKLSQKSTGVATLVDGPAAGLLRNPHYGSLKTSRTPPKVLPKPGSAVNRFSEPCNKENISHDFASFVESVCIAEADNRDKNMHDNYVRRRDSLSRFLVQRPLKTELMERNIIPSKSEEDRMGDRQTIGSKLNKRLSLRPTFEELEEKHILLKQTPEELEKEKEEKKKILIRKLSLRPTIDELKERKIIKFNDYVVMTDVEEYDRKADKPWTRLTAKDKAAIRKELNEFKSTEMDVHEESKHLTRFHRP